MRREDKNETRGRHADSEPRRQSAGGTPGKTTRASALGARPGAAIQRSIATGAGAAADVRPLSAWTHDPWMDAAHRGVAPGSGAGQAVQRTGAEGETGETLAPPTGEPGAAAPAAILSPEQVEAALAFYGENATFWPGPKVAQVSERLGIAPRETVDEAFVQAAAAFQQERALTVDGMLGSQSLMPLFEGQELDRAHTVANRITAVYESAGNYGVVQNVDVGIISFGAHQTTLASGNLGRMLQQYIDQATAAGEATDATRTIQGYMPRIEDQAQWESLRNETALLDALRATGAEQIMRDTQDAFFSEDFWEPAVRAGLHHGITSQLGFATLYDAKIQGGMEASLESARASLGGIVGSTVERDGGAHRITEAELLIAFNQAREGRLERIAQRREDQGKTRDAEMLRSSQVRPQAFEELARGGNLDLSANVDGQDQLDFATYGGRRAQIDAPPEVGTTPATPERAPGAQETAPAPEAPGRQQGGQTSGQSGGQPGGQPAAPEQAAPAAIEYRVRAGDTLGAIAERFLGSPGRWREIAATNGIRDPRALRVGQRLRIPGGDPQGATREPVPRPRPGPRREEQAGGGGAAGGGASQGGSASKPAWISVAEGEIGVREIQGARHNQRVIEYHSTTGRFSDDETPWCASFVNWVLQQAGQAGTGSAAAMSFQSYGTQLDRPAYGSIAVISYGGGRGHVAFVVGKQGDRLLLLGGNQSNAVNVKAFGTSQIVAYVVPAGYQVPAAAFQLGEAQDEVGEGGGVGNTR